MRIFLLFMVFSFFSLLAYSQSQCASAEYRMELFKRSPAFAGKAASIESFTKKIINSHLQVTNDSAGSITGMPKIITIPVVVHILYNNAAQNISDAQILSQIDVLNKDYQRQNADSVNTPEVFKPVAADCEIRFALANVDPQGKTSSGIIRKYTSIQGFSINDDMKSAASGGDDGWDPNQYLNIWVCNLVSGVLGYSSIPGGPTEKDGVVLQYSVFGTTGNVQAPFNKGRTATHEIGHWLNLLHTWGDADCGDDHVADTPPQRAANRGCPDAIRITCGQGPNGDMYMNYMDFTNDACMNLFTTGQKERMRALFAPGGVRNAMLSSNAVTALALHPSQGLVSDNNIHPTIQIFPNPTAGTVFIRTSALSTMASQLDIFNELGQKMMSFQLDQHMQQFDISRLKPGLYYIHFNDGKNQSVTKLIKN
ncbi:MAG: zinc metalloprotease [Bacteroidetes bacterium]|nr:MAG: zinc metalloprotease [Bacteroidota bacterium]